MRATARFRDPLKAGDTLLLEKGRVLLVSVLIGKLRKRHGPPCDSSVFHKLSF